MRQGRSDLASRLGTALAMLRLLNKVKPGTQKQNNTKDIAALLARACVAHGVSPIIDGAHCGKSLCGHRRLINSGFGVLWGFWWVVCDMAQVYEWILETTLFFVHLKTDSFDVGRFFRAPVVSPPACAGGEMIGVP